MTAAEIKQIKEDFLTRLNGKIDEDRWLFLINFAYDLAEIGHSNQQRDNGERYFEHCRRTALILIDELQIFDWELIVAALLHDMLEDSSLLDQRRISYLFGGKVAIYVDEITKPKRGNRRFKTDFARHQCYFDRLAAASINSKLVKLCDRLNNMREIGHCDSEKRERKQHETFNIYLPLIEDIRDHYPAAAEFFTVEFAKALGVCLD